MSLNVLELMTGTMILLLNVSNERLHVGPSSFNEAVIDETKTNTGVGDGNVPEIWKLLEKKFRVWGIN